MHTNIVSLIEYRRNQNENKPQTTLRLEKVMNMKNRRTLIARGILSALFAIIIMIVLISILTQKGNGTTDVDNSPVSEKDEDINTIQNNIINSLSSETYDWIDTIDDGIRVYTGEADVDITIRVIDPKAIAMVAEEVCPAAVATLENLGYSKYHINVRYYIESNEDGMGMDSLVDWSTKDGKSGMFVDESKEFMDTSYTVDDIYKYYDNFGKETIPVDESLIEPFQGEWKNARVDQTLIISGTEVNSIHYGISDDGDDVENIYTFYFEINDEGTLVVSNSHSQPRYILTITENGQLQESSTIDDDVEVFNRVSDNTVLPVIREEPYIGMSESDVRSSKWGYPQKTNSTERVNGTREQWVYDDGYIYLENGLVTSIQKK